MPVSGNDAIFSVQKNRVVLQLCGVAMELLKKNILQPPFGMLFLQLSLEMNKMKETERKKMNTEHSKAHHTNGQQKETTKTSKSLFNQERGKKNTKERRQKINKQEEKQE